MMRRFTFAIPFKGSQAAVGGAIGMSHEKGAGRLVQQDRHADLLEDKVALEVVARGSESLGAAGDHDHIRAEDVLVLEKLLNSEPNPLIEAAEHSGVSDIGLRMGLEVKYFIHGSKSSLQDVHPQHPPHKEQGNDGAGNVNNPVAGGFGLAEVKHGGMIAGADGR